jgi:hypothetical protein
MAEPNDFDQAARLLAKSDPIEVLAWVLDLPPDEFRFVRWLDTRSLPFPGSAVRVNDLVAHLEQVDPAGRPWLIAVEMQSEPDPIMFGRLLEYIGRLWQAEKPAPERGDRFCLGAAVVNLTGFGRTSLDFEWPPTGPRTCLRVMERNVGRVSGELTLAAVAGGTIGKIVLPLVPLMQGAGEAGIIEEWVRLASAEPDPRRNSLYGVLTRVFASRTDHAAEWNTALREWNMTRSPVVDEWRAEGLAAGVIAVLESRFQALVPELVTTIQGIKDLKRLDALVKLAAKAPSLDQFRADVGV